MTTETYMPLDTALARLGVATVEISGIRSEIKRTLNLPDLRITMSDARRLRRLWRGMWDVRGAVTERTFRSFVVERCDDWSRIAEERLAK